MLDNRPRPSGTARDAWVLRGQGHDSTSLSRANAFWDIRLRDDCGSWLGGVARARALGTTAPAFLLMLPSLVELLAWKPEQARGLDAVLCIAIKL